MVVFQFIVICILVAVESYLLGWLVLNCFLKMFSRIPSKNKNAQKQDCDNAYHPRCPRVFSKPSAYTSHQLVDNSPNKNNCDKNQTKGNIIIRFCQCSINLLFTILDALYLPSKTHATRSKENRRSPIHIGLFGGKVTG